MCILLSLLLLMKKVFNASLKLHFIKFPKSFDFVENLIFLDYI